MIALIQFIIIIVILIIVLMVKKSDNNNNNNNNNNKADHNPRAKEFNHTPPEDAFQKFIRQASMEDIRNMLLSALVRIQPTEMESQPYCVSNKLIYLYEILPEDMRVQIYPDEQMLNDYLRRTLEENPYLSGHLKKNNIHSYIQSEAEKVQLYDDNTLQRVLFNQEYENFQYKAFNEEIFNLVHKLIPDHVKSMRYSAPHTIDDFLHTINTNLRTLDYALNRLNTTIFGHVSHETLGVIHQECLVIYEFPKQYMLMSVARYGAVYINPAQGKYEYFTSGYNFTDELEITSQISKNYFHYGRRPFFTKAEFIHEVCLILNVDKSTLKLTNIIP